MPTQEYSSNNKHFWYLFAKVFSIVPVLMLAGFGLTFYIGTFRVDYINKYNKAVIPWIKSERDAFDNYTFNMTDSSGEEVFQRINYTTGTNYPTRDTCKLKGDPKGGCKDTEAMYYDEDFIFMLKDNHFIIKNSDGTVIVERIMDGTKTYSRTPEKMGCNLHPEYCEERCDEMGGFWDVAKQLCVITVYVDNICYRVVQNGTIWVLDTDNARELPQNKRFSMYESDGLGCDYGNNWNSVHYGKKRVSDVRVQIRSSYDSYLMASAYTRSCSNDNVIDNSCFGPTHVEEKYWCIIWIYVSCGLLIAEIIAFIVFKIITQIKFKNAVRGSYKDTTDPMLSINV